ncbi:MAG: tyrosine--tRNA ligase [Candidatus Pacebacteria bacterium]|nr:tyrosine--tRNA ligase [Candidatus Paceibacterota bacterium]
MFGKKQVKIDTDPKKIDELLSRSVKEILPSREDLKTRLLSGERLKIYIGTDATGSSLHLGHATNYLILEKFRALGHEVVFLIGDFTSRIGDPTDKGAARIPLSREQVQQNTKTWLKQIQPIIDINNKTNPVKVLYNHDWLAALTFEEILALSSHFTVQQMIERDMFDKRLQEGKPIYLHEFFYPLMQGYDSVAMNVDIEMCGNDQKFNALVGRTLLKKINNKEKFVFITTLLENPKTKEKMMSKSQGTGVYLDASAEDMYGGVMAQPDENISQLFIDATKLSLEEIGNILHAQDPKTQKMRLAHEVVVIYHGVHRADEAQAHWEKTFSKKEIPEDTKKVHVKVKIPLVEVLIKQGLVKSKTEFRKLVEEGAIKFHGEIEERKIIDPNSLVEESGALKIGKRRFLKIIVTKEK